MCPTDYSGIRRLNASPAASPVSCPLAPKPWKTRRFAMKGQIKKERTNRNGPREGPVTIGKYHPKSERVLQSGGEALIREARVQTAGKAVAVAVPVAQIQRPLLGEAERHAGVPVAVAQM